MMSAVTVSPPVKPVKFVGQYTSNADGTWSIPGMVSTLRYWVQPMSANAFVESLNITGTTLTGTFKMANTGVLGITLGNLASISAFANPSSPVTFNLFAAEDQTLGS
jgi:hypothetical protein